MNEMKIMKIIFISLLFIFFGVFMALLLALPTMWLWNALLPKLFGFPIITFWQSLGLCLLTRFLLGIGSSSSSSK
jgi:hypothetical protein